MNTENINMKPHSFYQLVKKEILHDKKALISLCLFVLILLFVFIYSIFIDEKAANIVQLKYINKGPSSEFLLGNDPSGRSMAEQFILGARNSFLIAFAVTLLGSIFGVILGLIAGYYGGHIDNTIMRIIDFIVMLPRLMIIIVLVTLIPNYSVSAFIWIMSAFSWMGKARLIRAKTLQQSNLDYVSASKTLGTSNFKIMFREVLPNISSIVIVNSILTLANNMGLETGLSFLGFGLPFSTPSLGTLLSYASTPENLQRRPWQWLPAALFVFIIMLCINFVGEAMNKAANAKERLS